MAQRRRENSRIEIENPKRQLSSNKWGAGWVDYYAGFSPHFAKSILENSSLAPRSVVADPWNGSGTTTEIASVLGFNGYGFDVNPVMQIIAKARMLRRTTTPSIKPLMREILESAKLQSSSDFDNDSLGFWFKPNGIKSIRKLEKAIQHLLIDRPYYSALHTIDLQTEVSDVAAFFYNALFKTVRRCVGRFQGSNPTWIRKPKHRDEKVTIGLNDLGREFRKQIDGMLYALEEVLFCHLDTDYVLRTASSQKLPLEDESVDMILSSPPYCTRIDYAVTTLPELAVLGYSEAAIRTLREKMIGTSTIAKTQPLVEKNWGKTCANLLKRIKNHPSKASASYYFKSHIQYFAGMSDSITECRRVLKPKGRCALVVQDSYYKDVHNDLPRIIAEMAESRKMILQDKIDFKQKRTMAGVHPGAKDYRKDFGATESVLIFLRSA
jgi:DNA modification methylase